jgi:release factor glutamine methyltransferase
MTRRASDRTTEFSMHTVAGARAWSIEELKKAGIESSALTTDLLLGLVLGWDRTRVLTHTEEILPEEAWARLQDLVRRRARGEPLHYLTGEKEFYGLAFRVTPDVLIPRPETEILVEKALDRIKNDLLPQTRFVDVGTGSGCIAVSVARGSPSSTGWAVDLSAAALRIARGNAIRHGVAGRIGFVQADLLECFAPKPRFGLILCNPPYVALTEYGSLPSDVRDYEPHNALFGGQSGLEIYRRLVPQIPSRLVPGGYFLLELGTGQGEPVRQLVEGEGLSLETVVNDLQGIPRCLIGRNPLRRNKK